MTALQYTHDDTLDTMDAPLALDSAVSHVRTSERWWRWLRNRGLTCPAGHHIPHTCDINESGFVRCSKWVTGRECGRWIFMVSIRGGGNIVAEVTLDEKAKMRQLTTPAEMLDFLGIFND